MKKSAVDEKRRTFQAWRTKRERRMEENTVLCGANSYLQKFYFNQEFDSLPQEVKQELQIMCVLYTEDVGGILTLEFDEK